MNPQRKYLIERAAVAIVNARAKRQGRPGICSTTPNINPLDLIPYEYRQNVLEEAEAAYDAINAKTLIGT